jgi:Kef-type K+ transport system membrane component KefB/nucleotide-binding universal stress UspA family protein
VFGELLAGIILGPSLLGWISPSLFSSLFPPDPSQYHLLELISWLGMIFLLVLTGLETEMTILRKLGRPALLASLFGIVIPFGCGYALGSAVPDRFIANPDQRLVFELFMGTAMAISSVPVIAKILMDLAVLRRDIGPIIMGAAIVDDVIGWTILSTLIGMTRKGVLDVGDVLGVVFSTAAFVAIALLVGIRLVRRLMRWLDERAHIEEAHMTAVMVLTLTCCAITEAIGIHAVFGAFVAGVILAQSPRVRASALEKLAGVVHGIFSPVFFAFVGLRVDLTYLSDPTLVVVVIAVACVGKLVGCTLGGLLGGLSWWSALSVGIGMNARGGVELIIALIGLTSGILSQEVYASLVLMAIVTTLMAPPLLQWSLGHVALSSDEQARLNEATQRSIFDKRTLRVLLPTAGGPNALMAFRLAIPLVTHEDATITALYVSADGRPRPQGIITRLWRRQVSGDNDPLQIFRELARTAGVTIESKVVEEGKNNLPQAINKEAARGYDLLLLGASGYQHPLGGDFLDEILRDPPTHVAILKARDEKAHYERILVPTAHDAYSQLAVEFAAMYAEDVDAQVTLLYIVPPAEHPERFWFRKRYAPLDHNVLKMMADTILWELRPSRAKPNLRLTAKVVESEQAAEEILREIRRGGHDLLVFGTGNPAGRSTALLGRRAEDLVNQAPCTVVAVLPKSLRTGIVH